MLRYAQFQHATLQRLKIVRPDLMTRAIRQRIDTMGTVTRVITVNLPPTVSSDSTSARSFSLNCGALAL